MESGYSATYNIITDKRGFVYMRKAKIFSVLSAFILLFTIFGGSLPASAAFTPKFALNSEGVYMVNLDTDIVLVSKNADKKLYPASTTKIMTCLVALANIKDFDAKVEVTYDAFNEFQGENINFQGVSDAAIEPLQDNLTYKDCLYTLMVCSACESANILAYNVGGRSIENFVAMMNDMAKKIGCKNTHFSNPHGLFDEDNYTTAYDLYLITKYAMENYPAFMKICGTTEYDMPANRSNPEGYTKYTTNSMMKPSSEYYYEGVTGIKTGSIDKYFYKKDGGWSYDNFDYGSRALVTTAQRNGYTYLIVSLGAPYCNDDGTATETLLNFTDHINLYNWAFDEFEYTLVIRKNQQIMQADVAKGKDADNVAIIATEDYYTLLPKSLDITTIQQIRPVVEMLEAPVDKGRDVGKLELRLNGETLAKLKLVTEDSVELDMAAYYKEKLGNIMKTPQFTAIVVVLVLLIIVAIVASALNKSYRRKQAEAARRRKMQMSPQARNAARRPQQRPNDRRHR